MDNFRDSYFQINWDLGKKRLNNSVWGKQYDTGRGLAITLINNGIVVTPSTEIIRLKWEKSDGTAGYVNSTVVSGKFLLENIDQMFTVAGMVKADLELQVAGEFVASVTFFVSVDKAIAVDAIESSSDFTALQDALADVGDMQAQVDAVIANATVDSEVILARGTEPTLGARLNEIATGKGIASNAITIEKTTFVKIVSKNLMNINAVRNGGYYDNNSGLWVEAGIFYTSDFIKVEAGQQYTRNTDSIVVFYDDNHNFMSGLGAPNTATITIPAGVSYARFTFRTTVLKPQINKGSVLDAYDNYKISVNDLEITDKVDAFKIDAIQGVLTENLFDKSKASAGYYNSSGVFVNDTNYMQSDFIPVIEGATYTKLTSGFHSLWTEEKTFVQTVTSTAFIVPSGLNIKYVRIITTRANLDLEMLVRGAYPAKYIPYKKRGLSPDLFSYSRVSGLKWNACGDSITANFQGRNYVDIVARELGLTPTIYAISGRSIASRGSTTDTQYPPIVTDYVNMTNDADIITVFAGVNDYHSQVPLGNIASTTITEFYGALNVLALGLIEKYQGKRIALITPMQRASIVKTIPLTDYVKAVKDIGFKYGIPVFDLYNNCGLYPDSIAIKSAYFDAEGLHPNEKGYKVFAPRIAAFLETL